MESYTLKYGLIGLTSVGVLIGFYYYFPTACSSVNRAHRRLRKERRRCARSKNFKRCMHSDRSMEAAAKILMYEKHGVCSVR